MKRTKTPASQIPPAFELPKALRFAGLREEIRCLEVRRDKEVNEFEAAIESGTRLAINRALKYYERFLDSIGTPEAMDMVSDLFQPLANPTAFGSFLTDLVHFQYDYLCREPARFRSAAQQLMDPLSANKAYRQLHVFVRTSQIIGRETSCVDKLDHEDTVHNHYLQKIRRPSSFELSCLGVRISADAIFRLLTFTQEEPSLHSPIFDMLLIHFDEEISHIKGSFGGSRSQFYGQLGAIAQAMKAAGDERGTLKLAEADALSDRISHV